MSEARAWDAVAQLEAELRNMKIERDRLQAENQRLKERVQALEDIERYNKQLENRIHTAELENVSLRRRLQPFLPKVSDLSGRDPDFTGGQATEEYVREMREDKPE